VRRSRRRCWKCRPDKVACLTQTTLSVDDANVLIDRLRGGTELPARIRKTSLRHPKRQGGSSRRRPGRRCSSSAPERANSIHLTEVAAIQSPDIIDSVGEIDRAWFPAATNGAHHGRRPVRFPSLVECIGAKARGGTVNNWQSGKNTSSLLAARSSRDRSAHRQPPGLSASACPSFLSARGF
jgi:hypothetical protein